MILCSLLVRVAVLTLMSLPRAMDSKLSLMEVSLLLEGLALALRSVNLLQLEILLEYPLMHVPYFLDGCWDTLSFE